MELANASSSAMNDEAAREMRSTLAVCCEEIHGLTSAAGSNRSIAWLSGNSASSWVLAKEGKSPLIMRLPWRRVTEWTCQAAIPRGRPVGALAEF